MSIRWFTYHILTPLRATAGPGASSMVGRSSREEQLAAQVGFADRRLNAALRLGSLPAIRAADRFLTSCQNILTRWLDRRYREEDSSAQQERQRDTDMEWEATRQLLGSRKDIQREWQVILNEVRVKAGLHALALG